MSTFTINLTRTYTVNGRQYTVYEGTESNAAPGDEFSVSAQGLPIASLYALYATLTVAGTAASLQVTAAQLSGGCASSNAQGFIAQAAARRVRSGGNYPMGVLFYPKNNLLYLSAGVNAGVATTIEWDAIIIGAPVG